MRQSAQQRVNYDTIAHLYDEPLRDHAPDPELARFIEKRAVNSADLCILDMGCGTGKQIAANRAAYSGTQIVGMDLFAGMLAQAQRRSSEVMLVQGNSMVMPFRAESFDYISNQFSYHHILDKPKMVKEIFRLLKPSGRFVMTNIDPWSMPNWLIFKYFPAAWERDKVDFLLINTFVDLMRQVGFSSVESQLDPKHEVVSFAQFVAHNTPRFRHSELMCIPDNEYEIGVANLKQDLAKLGTPLPPTRSSAS